MKILIIGGTRFVGRHLVDSALAHGHEVTLFNRGQTNPGLFPQVETILGDRAKDLHRLASRKWDTVIDSCGYLPGYVKLSTEGLKDSVQDYTYISSIAAYADFKKIGIDETYPLGELEDESDERPGYSYGARKAACEKAVQAVFGNRSLILRPGRIVGPYDPIDRFTYWPVRVARGGNVLALDRFETPVQVIDMRDLSDFCIKSIERNTSGVFNATGPDYNLTFGKLLETCKQVTNSNANFKWPSIEFLDQNKVQVWSDISAWLPNGAEATGFDCLDISRAVRAGLVFRPLEETVRDTLAWANTRPAGYEWRAGLKPEREAELLALLGP